jgi:hypothetical protein
MFHANGKRRKDPKLLPEVGAACAERLAPKPVEPAGEAPASPRPEPPDFAPGVPATKAYTRQDPRIVLDPTLLTGKGCRNGARRPRFAYDKRLERMRLVGETLRWEFTWGIGYVERRDLVTISTAPPIDSGVVPFIELFVAPRCDSYEISAVHERLAARGLIDLLPQADTVDQMRRGDWKVERGGPKQESFIIPSAVLSTPRGPRRIALYTTKVVESKSFTVHAAAVCPALGEPGSKFSNTCERSYFRLLTSVAE